MDPRCVCVCVFVCVCVCVCVCMYVCRLSRRGIRVAEYLTELPPRTLLVTKLNEAMRLARERLKLKRGKQ